MAAGYRTRRGGQNDPGAAVGGLRYLGAAGPGGTCCRDFGTDGRDRKFHHQRVDGFLVDLEPRIRANAREHASRFSLT